MKVSSCVLAVSNEFSLNMELTLEEEEGEGDEGTEGDREE